MADAGSGSSSPYQHCFGMPGLRVQLWPPYFIEDDLPPLRGEGARGCLYRPGHDHRPGAAGRCGGGSAGVHLADGPASLPQEEVSLTVQRDAEPLVESVVVIPQVQVEHYVLTPGTPEAEEVAEILSDYTYRRCWKTCGGIHLSPAWGRSGVTSMGLILM